MVDSLAYESFAPNPVTRDGKTMLAPAPGTIARGVSCSATAPSQARRARGPGACQSRGRTERRSLVESACSKSSARPVTGCGVWETARFRAFSKPPSLLDERARALPDGHIFHIITMGRGLMASHGSQVTPEDRWKNRPPHPGASGRRFEGSRSVSAGPVIGPRARGVCAAAAVAGTGAFAAGAAVQPKAAFAALLIVAFFFLTLAAGAVVFLAIANVSKAGWHTAFKRVPEAMAACLPLPALAIVIALAGLTTRMDHAAADHVAAYLEPSFLLGRAAAFLVLWIVFAVLLRRNSIRQDADGDPRHSARNVTLSAAFLVLFLLTFSMASMDWLMSLTPHWASTIFGLYNIAGLLAGSVAAIAIAVVRLRSDGRLPATNGNDVHDLGKLLFGFVTLWAYLWFSQYLLIWYREPPRRDELLPDDPGQPGGHGPPVGERRRQLARAVFHPGGPQSQALLHDARPNQPPGPRRPLARHAPAGRAGGRLRPSRRQWRWRLLQWSAWSRMRVAVRAASRGGAARRSQIPTSSR